MMAQLGVELAPILRSPTGSPQEKAALIWPPRGIVGSITPPTATGPRWWRTSCRSGPGLSTPNPTRRCPMGCSITSIAEERTVLATRPADCTRDRLLFCAKEATFKTWFLLTKRWLGFEDAHITFEQTGDNEDVRVQASGRFGDRRRHPLTSFDGCGVEQNFILTSIALN